VATFRINVKSFYGISGRSFKYFFFSNEPYAAYSWENGRYIWEKKTIDTWKRAFIICTFIVAVATSWVLLVPGVILMGLSMAFSSPAWTALTAESVEKKKRGTTFGVCYSTSSAHRNCAPALTWLLVGWKGLRIIFWAYFATTITNLILTVLFLEETLDVSIQMEHHKHLNVKKIFKELLKPERGSKGFYFAVTLDTFAWELGMQILYGMLYDQLGITVEQLAVLSAVFSASMGLSQVPI